MNKILLGSAVTMLLLAGCSDEKKTTAQATAEVSTQQTTTQTSKEVVAEATKEVAQTVTAAASEVSKTVVEATNKVVENTVEATKELATTNTEPAKGTVENKTPKVKEVVNSTISTLNEKESEVKETVLVANENKIEVTTEENKVEVVQEQGPDGAALYKTCSACHGEKAEKEALGKSQVIAGWSKEKLISAMNGYKDGSYGGVMKNIMKSQVSTKTDSEIDALAEFISKL